MSEENDNGAPMNNEKDNLVSEEQEVTQETAGNKNEKQDDSRNEILENMLKAVLDKQKNLVDELRSVKSELQLIRDDLKPKSVIAAVSNETDDEDETDSESENESATMTTTGKYFVLKHDFKNVSSFKNLEKIYSEKEEHFGVPWRILIQRNTEKEHFGIFLSCAAEMDDQKMSFDVVFETKIMSNSTRKWSKKTSGDFQNSIPKNEMGPELIEWAVLEKDYLVDDQLTAEIHVRIKKTAGIYKDNLRSFDETMEEFSDVVLVVNEEKFYVSKLYLAAHSPYFKALFLGNFNDSKKSEIKLTGIDDDDFQKYLEVLYGESAIDEFTAEGILMVADMYDTPLVIRKCEEFLLEKSKKSLKKNLDLSTRYNLEGLKEQCLDKIKSVADIRSVIPGDIRELDPSIMSELLKKSLALHSPQ
ncbi:hypothetical protein GCK72_006863 [Caenorhabditis remanei]|uniref:BTB domain-containing protein n=1 Tax=Caenorhabditis remanei TaxID=31234 RepID=A0A6A5HHE3_CAERE|nr:hypothetical protein GCK72_006863 [Caenorhabditis remanei]KAF1766905.1 hypothetical protein GCK72_006863 [Caenorhabditis remanei]